MTLDQIQSVVNKLEADPGDLDGRIAQLREPLHRTETALRAKELQCGRVLEVMSDAIFVVEPNGCICQTNSAACRMYGCERSELIGEAYKVAALNGLKRVGNQNVAAEEFDAPQGQQSPAEEPIATE